MADQAFPDGDLAHPDQPNAYGPVQYPVRSHGQLVPSTRPDIDARIRARAEAQQAPDPD